jgi:hypothetical protein
MTKSSQYRELLLEMERNGWRVEFHPHPRALPTDFLKRYHWLPEDHRDLIEAASVVLGPDERAWLLTVNDFSMQSDCAFAWNEWERQSLDAADGDDVSKQRIRSFWDDHLPVLMSVKSGYAYFAIERTSLRVVRGDEPEYEVAVPLASSFLEMLQRIVRRDPELDVWI